MCGCKRALEASSTRDAKIQNTANPMPWNCGSKALKTELSACEAISASPPFYNDKADCCVKMIGVTVNGRGNKVGLDGSIRDHP